MESLLYQLREIWAERRRVGLVTLGVLWGTLSLIVLLAFGSEMADATTHTMRNFGVHLLRFAGGATTRPFEGLPAGRAIQLLPEDAEAVREALTERYYQPNGLTPEIIPCIMVEGSGFAEF